MYLPQHNMERHLARNFEDRVFQSLTAGYKLPGIVRQRATSLSAVQLVQGFFFCSLLYTFRYMFVNACAFSEPHAHATAL